MAQFAIEFVTAPRKRIYLRKHWVTALSLMLPAFASQDSFVWRASHGSHARRAA